MGISSKGPDLTGVLARVGDSSPGLSGIPELVAESYRETVTAPAIGDTASLRYGPLVEANLTLTAVSGGREYEPGLDYLEDPAGGFVNRRIPEGSEVTAEYFYLGDPPVSEAVSPGSAESAVGVRYATLLKYGG